MKKIIFLMAFSLFLFNYPSIAEIYQYTNSAGRVVQTTTPPAGARKTDNSPGIGSYCRDKWGMDFEMRKYCEDRQRQAKMSLGRYSKNILEFCTEKWNHDYEMVAYCAKNQTIAKKQLGE